MLASASKTTLLVSPGTRATYYPMLMQALVFTSVLGLGVSFHKVYLFHLVLACVVVFNLCHHERGLLFDGLRIPSKYHIFFSFMFAWFALGLAWSWERSYTFQYLGYIACGGALAVLVVKYVGTSLTRFQQMFHAAKWAFALDVAVGILEATTPFRLPISPFSSGHASESLNDFSSEAMTLITSMPTGFHWNPNNYAMVVCLLIPFFLFHKQVRWTLLGAGVIIFLVYSADSRASLVAIVFMLLLLPALRGNTAWIFVGLAFATCAQLSLVSNSDLGRTVDTVVSSLERYAGMDQGDELDSIGVRRHLIENGLEALVESNALGVGGGADKYVQEERFALPVKNVVTSMHHTWIELLVNGGIVFFVPFVCWYASLSFDLFRHSRRWPQASFLGYSGRSLALALCGLIPAAVAASTAVYVLPMYLLFGMAIAWVNVNTAEIAQQTRATASRIQHKNSRRQKLRGIA